MLGPGVPGTVPLDLARNFMQFASTNVSIACIFARFEPKLMLLKLAICYKNCVVQNQHVLECFRQSVPARISVMTIG